MNTTTTHKTSDKNTVLSYTESLFKSQGKATTLEVKTAMRADGYWAEQKQVSSWMSELSDEHNWQVDQGQFRTYSPAQTSTSSSSTTTTTQSSTVLATLMQIFTTLFGIHKYAINSDSKIGSDLGVTDSSNLTKLSDEIKKEFDVDVSDRPLDKFTVGELEKTIDNLKKKTSPVAKSKKRSGRVRVNLQPSSVITGKTPADKDFKQHISTLGLNQDDWVLFIGTKYRVSADCMVYAGSESRDHVRTSYARNVSSKIQMTRAIRVKNIK